MKSGKKMIKKQKKGSEEFKELVPLMKVLKQPSKVPFALVPLPISEVSLSRAFYQQDVVTLSPALLGKIICRKKGKITLYGMIVETEAYRAPEDKACHAYKGKTDRTKWFWEDGGSVYVYSIYGQNMCFNVVAGTKGIPWATLIRAIAPVGTEKDVANMVENRYKGAKKEIKTLRQYTDLSVDKLTQQLYLQNGPGKVGSAMSITKELNGKDLTDKTEEIYIIDNPEFTFKIGTSKRKNIDYAEEWIDKEWRFFIEGNPFVSK